jgi:tripeptide aminopeptidase
VDTSPEMSGRDVKPIVHRGYGGGDIVLPDDPSAVLRPADWPYLAECVGHDIVTASGTTLLGADNKAGVAAIMAAAEYLQAHPEIRHGAIRIAFTPDEEVGNGTKYFDVAAVRRAVRLHDGRRPARRARVRELLGRRDLVTFQGFNTHPGYAKDRMVNAIKLAARFIERLPPDRLSPETTDGYEGYVHPYVVDASVDRTTVKLLVRDFVTAGLKEKEAWLEGSRGGRGRVAGRVVTFTCRSPTATCAR